MRISPTPGEFPTVRKERGRGGGGSGADSRTLDSIQTWALEEARRRLEVEGVVPDSTKKIAITEQLKTVSGK
jgi:hypothetical protein